MKIKRSNLWYQMVQQGEVCGFRPSETITLCGLFWRGIFTIMGYGLFFVALPAVFILGVSTLWWALAVGIGGWWGLAKGTAVVLLAIAALIYKSDVVAPVIAKGIDNSIIINYAKARKKKVCPIIQLEG